MIKLTFLGTSDAIPTAERNHTSILLTYKNEDILIDCGEGTQRQMRKAELRKLKCVGHWLPEERKRGLNWWAYGLIKAGRIFIEI